MQVAPSGRKRRRICAFALAVATVAAVLWFSWPSAGVRVDGDTPCCGVAVAYVELLLAGMATGFLAGLLGIGGGFVAVPVLILLLPTLGIEANLVPKVAVATSLAAMVPTACSAVIAQYRSHNLDQAWLRRIAPAAAFGAAVGTQVAAAASGPWIAVIFASYTGYFAVKMLRDLPLRGERTGPLGRCLAALPVAAVGALIGAFSALAGVGGASLTIPYLLFLGAGMKQAVAVASGVGLAIALAGTTGFASAALAQQATSELLAGLIHWPAALLLAATAVLMAPRGVTAANRLPVPQLKRAFGAVLVAACLATVIKQFPVDAAFAYAVTGFTSHASEVRERR